MPLLGDTEAVLQWAGAIGGTITIVGGAAVALWFLFGSKRVELAKKYFAVQKDEAAAVAAADKAKRDEAIAALTAIIEDLREQVERQSHRYGRLQSSIMDVRKADVRDMEQLRAQLHECEKRHGILERSLEDNTRYTRTLEERLAVLEKGSRDAPASDR